MLGFDEISQPLARIGRSLHDLSIQTWRGMILDRHFGSRTFNLLFVAACSSFWWVLSSLHAYLSCNMCISSFSEFGLPAWVRVVPIGGLTTQAPSANWRKDRDAACCRCINGCLRNWDQEWPETAGTVSRSWSACCMCSWMHLDSL